MKYYYYLDSEGDLSYLYKVKGHHIYMVWYLKRGIWCNYECDTLARAMTTAPLTGVHFNSNEEMEAYLENILPEYFL